MNDRTPPDDREPTDAELGPPIAELAELRHEPVAGFLDTVHGRISRKVLGVNVARYVWFVPLLVVLEFLKMAFQIAAGDDKGATLMDGGFDPKQQLIQIYESLVQSVTAAAPRVLTGILVILVALIGAKVIQRILAGVLARVGFDKALERVGLDKMMQRIGVTQKASVFLPRVVYYLLLFLFGQAVADAMGLTAISGALSSFLGYLPHVVAALLVLVVGSLLGNYAGQMVSRSATDAGLDFASTLGNLVSALVLFIAGIMAVGQLKIDTDIVRIVSVCSLAGIALAFGLSFGLGSREFTQNIIAGFYAKKLFSPGDDVEVQGRRGVIHEMTAVHVQLEADGEIVALSNTAFMDQVIKR